MEIKKIISAGENLKVEFKTSFNAEVIETLVAFANAKGGIVLVGVSNEGVIKGTTLQPETIQQWINEIKTKTSPQVVPESEIIEIDTKIVIKLSVSEYPVKPVAFKGRFYKRVNNSNHLLNALDVVNLHLQSVNSSWDFYIRADKTIDDISFEKIENVIEQISGRTGNRSIEKPLIFLQKNELLKNNSITNACYLMFCKDQTIQTTIELGFFASETSIKDSITCKTDILSQVDIVMDFVKKHINKETIITGNKASIERWQYPLEAIRELVLNMIVHRDYTSAADSQVKIFPDRIIFYNPGLLSSDISIEQLYTSDYISYSRNKQIAQFVKDLGWIEKYGTGIKRVIELFEKSNLPTPVIRNQQNGVFVEIRSGYKDLDKDLEKDLEKDNLTTRQMLILNELIRNKKITQQELSKKIGINDKNIRNNLQTLKEKGLIKRIGPDKGGYWEVLK